MGDMYEKLEKLKAQLEGYARVAVAFSGGVDSAFLLKVAKDVLTGNCIAVTVRSGLFPQTEFMEASGFCSDIGVRQEVVEGDAIFSDEFISNPPDRCYICKRSFFSSILSVASSHGITTVCEGSNIDDLGDYRPGLKAISELGIKSPLRDCGFTKSEIRLLSAEFALPTSNKPSMACLASRIPYGERITGKKLAMVEEAENFLRGLGFRQSRVRIHGDTARIEIEPECFDRLMHDRDKTIKAFKDIGFAYVSLDLCGYRTGSMNEVLQTVR
ncbi:MAG: ATP-dependent sacrificial sulfur transferase LarE [Kiritimatiellae bacterium]|nr:ATP-dependent sacrificial sulfur transferase LarE [Kiritimatiellia bacterium]